MGRRIGTGIMVCLVGTTLAVGSASGADAATVNLPQTLTGGSGALWTDFSNNGGCGPTNGLTVEDAELGVLSDAYDDALEAVDPDSSTAFTSPTSVDVADQTLTSTNNFMGMSTTVEHKALQDSATLRSRYTFTNNTGATISKTLAIQSNLGSDSGTKLRATSSGSTTWTPSDHWLITADTLNPVSSSDPFLTHALYGSGQLATNYVSYSCSTQSNTPSNGNLDIRWPLSVPAGATRSIVIFEQMTPSMESATAGATAFTSLTTNSTMFTGLSGTERAQILNWGPAAGTPANSCVKVPSKIKRKKTYTLMTKGCATTGGSPIKVTGKGKLMGRGDMFTFKIYKTKSGVTKLKTGPNKLKLALTWSANATTGYYTAYSKSKSYTVK